MKRRLLTQPLYRGIWLLPRVGAGAVTRYLGFAGFEDKFITKPNYLLYFFERTLNDWKLKPSDELARKDTRLLGL